MANILIIDDDANLRQLLRLILKRQGHSTAEACDGDEAVRAAGAAGFDLALCDILMPGREGLETIRELRRGHPSLPVIAMSGGLAAMDPLKVASCLGARRTLAKPFRAEQLLAVVEELLGESGRAGGSDEPPPERTPTLTRGRP